MSGFCAKYIYLWEYFMYITKIRHQVWLFMIHLFFVWTVKDERILASKYDIAELKLHTPNTVVTFSNNRPKVDQLAQDRWRIFKIKENDYVTQSGATTNVLIQILFGLIFCFISTSFEKRLSSIFLMLKLTRIELIFH